MNKSELAKQLLEKYIDIALKNNKQFSKRYLATVLYNENPDVFKDVEDARGIIRFVTNSHGTENVSKNYEELARRFALIPEQIREIENTEPYIIPKTIKKSLVIADVHGRFYNKKALEIALEYGIKQKCDSVIIDGSSPFISAFTIFHQA